MYEGRTAAKPGTVLGHENMGVVEEVGPGVTSIKVGDRVVLPFNIACGFCYNCLRGYPNACLTVNPAAPHAAYGYAQMGPFRGGQADYLRVPYADYNCLKLPGQPGDQWEDDFVLLADIWPTGHHGVVLAGVTTGSTVGIFGAGPVGLMATLSAIMMGAPNPARSSAIACLWRAPRTRTTRSTSVAANTPRSCSSQAYPLRPPSRSSSPRTFPDGAGTVAGSGEAGASRRLLHRDVSRRPPRLQPSTRPNGSSVIS